MNVSKLNNYIKLSDLSSQVLDNLEDYESILITGNINCCETDCEEQVNTFSLSLDNIGFSIDLDDAVKLNNIIYKLNIKSVYSLISYNAITTPIDLGYVEDNCGVGTCTLADYPGYFSSAFKTQIDAWFASIGIITNVSISFDGNVMTVTGMPDEFVLEDIEFNSSDIEPYSKIAFGFTNADSNVYMSNDAIYIKPEFFNLQELNDGIYKFNVKYIKVDEVGYLEEQNCSFIDVTTKCRVASVLQNILKESKELGSEKSSTIIHILHYALVNGSNCGCNCPDLCQVYKELIDMLDSIDPQITNDCGC